MVANILMTYRGLNDRFFLDKYTFHIGPIRTRKEYLRILSSGFLHVNWMHLFFNMFTLYFFGPPVEQAIGILGFALVYMISLLGGNFFALYLRRNNPDYKAVGASGAVSGVVFAAIALFPGMRLAFLFLPIPMPGWVFGLGYVLYSIYGIRSSKDNIGHEAHLGGGIAGLLATLAIFPDIIEYNYLPIILILVPSIIFLFFIVLNPERIGLKGLRPKRFHPYTTIDDDYHEKRKRRQEELNRLLEKINERGMDSLSDQEKKFLKDNADKF